MHSTNRSQTAIYFSPIWNGWPPSFQHRAAAVFPCGKGGEKCSFPHWKSAGGVQMICRCAAMAGDRRFRMPAALLWAFSAEKLFFSLGQRNACGRSAVPFSREGHGRQAAGAAPAFDGSGGTAQAVTERVGCKNKPSRADKVPERAYKTIFYALAAAHTRGMQRRRGQLTSSKWRYTAA